MGNLQEEKSTSITEKRIALLFETETYILGICRKQSIHDHTGYDPGK